MQYLGVIFTNSRTLKCSLDAAKRGFYRAANSTFGKVGRIASEEVITHLIKCIFQSYTYFVLSILASTWNLFLGQLTSFCRETSFPTHAASMNAYKTRDVGVALRNAGWWPRRRRTGLLCVVALRVINQRQLLPLNIDRQGGRSEARHSWSRVRPRRHFDAISRNRRRNELA